MTVIVVVIVLFIASLSIGLPWLLVQYTIPLMSLTKSPWYVSVLRGYLCSVCVLIYGRDCNAKEVIT